MTTSADVGVIGAGVIGLAIARRLARVGPEVFVVEKRRFPERPARLRVSLDD